MQKLIISDCFEISYLLTYLLLGIVCVQDEDGGEFYKFEDWAMDMADGSSHGK